LVKDLREAIAKDDDERIKTLMPELQQALFAVGNLYQQGGGGTTAGGPSRMIAAPPRLLAAAMM